MSPPAAPIDFTRYAEVTATLRRFPADKRDEVIARLGLRRRAWEAAAASWAAARDAELACGKTALTVRFAEVLTRTRERLEAQRASLESLGPLPGPDEIEPEPVPDPEPEPPPLFAMAPPVVQLISSQLAPPQPAAPSFLRQPVVYEAPVLVVAAPPVVLPAAHLQSTLPLGAQLPLARLPFQEAPAAPERAFAAAVAHAEVVQGPAQAPVRRGDQGGTVGVSSEARPAALPFAAREPGKASGSGGPELTLEQYASLRVELQSSPAAAPAILARYGVAEGARDALEAHWRARFEADPPMRMEFARAYAAYTAWLRSNPRPHGR